MDNTATILILSSVLIIAVVGVLYLTLTKNRPKLNVARYQTKWLEVENRLRRDNTASYVLVILYADKLLDQALRERHFKGKTMGERMKSANNSWSNANHVWAAHKIRNRLAHEPDVRINFETAQRTLTAFKQALKDLGAI